MTIKIIVTIDIDDKLVERDGRRSFTDLIDEVLEDDLAELEEELTKGADPDDVDLTWEMNIT